MRRKQSLIIVGLGLALLLWVGNGRLAGKGQHEEGTTPENSGESKVTKLEPTAFHSLVSDPQVFLLDVHIPEQTHIPGTDAFIPYNEIAQKIEKLPVDKQSTIAVYCRSGTMSEQAGKELIKRGFTNVYDLAGGINAYKDAFASVEVTPKTQNLGTVNYEHGTQTTFTLTNFTSAPLKISRVSTSCGCTQASVDKQTLEPYEATAVRVSFNPAVHKDDTDLGDVRRTIYLDTDNPNFPSVTADITATVIKS